MNYVYEDGKLWFHGAKSGHKLDAIRRDPKVSFFVAETDQLVPEALTTYFRSVIAFGKVRILEDPEEVFAAIRKLGLQLNPDEDAVEKEIRREWAGLCCVEIGDNAVIGAGSVVTRFIPGNMLAVGVPGDSGNYGSGQDTRSAGRNDRRFSEKPFPFVEKRKIRS